MALTGRSVQKTPNTVEDSVTKCLIKLLGGEFPPKSLGVAVSGGSDSVCLLLILAKFSRLYNIPLRAVTVDHKIRESAQSAGDALFTQDLCNTLKNDGVDISCTIIALKDGEVSDLAAKRKCGLEDAARVLRYEAFKRFALTTGVRHLCLAHNKNDCLETALIHILQGSNKTTISPKRAVPLDDGTQLTIIRPLLEIDKSTILNYLKNRNQNYKTDLTNYDESYLRNRIRHSLIPLLNDKFTGWDSALLNGADKAVLDEDYFTNECKKIVPLHFSPTCVTFSRSTISLIHKSIAVRVTFLAITKISDKAARVPYHIINTFIDSLKTRDKFTIKSSGFEFTFNRDALYIRKIFDLLKDTFYWALIKKSGSYHFPFGDLLIEEKQQGVQLTFIFEKKFIDTILNNFPNTYDNDSSKCFLINGLRLPFCIRSTKIGDVIHCAIGNKKIRDILSRLQLPAQYKHLIPVIDEFSTGAQKTVALIAGPFGGKNTFSTCNNH